MRENLFSYEISAMWIATNNYVRKVKADSSQTFTSIPFPKKVFCVFILNRIYVMNFFVVNILRNNYASKFLNLKSFVDILKITKINFFVMATNLNSHFAIDALNHLIRSWLVTFRIN